MKATFENTNEGDRLTLDGTLCEVASKNTYIGVAPVNVEVIGFFSAEAFDAAGYLHLSGTEETAE